ncbi:MAG: hypothetical protein GF416_06365 [Candidatus Altiarchaeales archaeon]|nr:hypothetical protein [Candidatus Altiarchaeales archaeon]MBD3416738.1 hypothetical protein [Candidatus Altiarchaeales archaeon]
MAESGFFIHFLKSFYMLKHSNLAILALLILSPPAVAELTFPDHVPALDLTMVEESLNSRSYASTDDRIVAIFEKQHMSSSEWTDLKKGYEQGNVGKATYSGHTLYYICEMAGSDEEQCFFDFYSDGVYYTLDVSILNPEKDETKTAAFEIINEAKYPARKPSSTVPSPDRPADTACVCMPVLTLLLSAASVIVARAF